MHRMNRRTPIFALIATVVVTMLGPSPAHAELDDPVASSLNATTPGHVTGTVTSVAPYVSVRLGTDVARQIVTLSEGSGTFDLETWGYSGTIPVYVSSCEVDTPVNPEDCSPDLPSAETFTPTDVVPDVTWPTDPTVGPADDPVVTATDPDGGGDLRAVWDHAGTDLETAVTPDVATPLNLSDGSGLVRLVRCRAGSTTVCSAFSPDQTVDLVVNQVLTATVDEVADLTGSNPSTDVTVTTDASGTYELTWTLEQDGSLVAGQGGTDSGALDGTGVTDPFSIDGSSLLDGVYDIEVVISVADDAEFGDFPATAASGTVVVDGSGPTASVTVGPVTKITQANPVSAVTVNTDRTGTYSLTWHLEQGGTEVAGVGATVPGTLDGSGAATFGVSGATLTDGVYTVVTSIVVTDPTIGTYPPAEATGTVTVDKTGLAAVLTRSVGTIYPLIATTAYPTLTRIDVTGDPTPITGFVVRSVSGKVVRTLSLNVNRTVWNGRDNLGKVVAAGTFSISSVDTDGNRGASSTQVTVSRQTLVLKKFVREVTASGSMFDRFVGSCSQLKIPSSRGTRGSLGFYANTKCATQTFSASAVSTAHAVTLPIAAKYVDVRVDITGGAATAKRASKGIVRYLNTKGAWTSETAISSPYGIHTGPTRSTAGLVDPNRFFVWGFVTAYGSRYDVIRFTVVVRYYALS